MGIVDKAKQAAIAATVTKALDYLEKDPETNIPKIMEMVDKVTPDGWYAGQRNAIRHSIEAKDNWYQLILRMYQLDAGVRQTFFRNFIVNASLKGSATQEKVSEENDCNVPWAILLDPTSACNLHCTGCWAADPKAQVGGGGGKDDGHHNTEQDRIKRDLFRTARGRHDGMILFAGAQFAVCVVRQ